MVSLLTVIFFCFSGGRSVCAGKQMTLSILPRCCLWKKMVIVHWYEHELWVQNSPDICSALIHLLSSYLHLKLNCLQSGVKHWIPLGRFGFWVLNAIWVAPVVQSCAIPTVHMAVIMDPSKILTNCLTYKRIWFSDWILRWLDYFRSRKPHGSDRSLLGNLIAL